MLQRILLMALPGLLLLLLLLVQPFGEGLACVQLHTSLGESYTLPMSI